MNKLDDIFNEIDSLKALADMMKLKAEGLRTKLLHFHGVTSPTRGKRKPVSDAMMNEIIKFRIAMTKKPKKK